MKKTSMAFIIVFITFYCQCLFAHDQEKVHPDITQFATEKSNLDAYLKKYLNFENGLSTALPTDGGKSILYLLREGSKQEDSLDTCRASNHFLNPLKTWDAAGLSDSPLWADVACFLWKPYYSAVTWATGFTSPTGPPIPYNPYNEKSPNVWTKARILYYNALTATNQTTRENSFAQMFQSLGQAMHLIQDMSVPAHVRNDFKSHIVFTGCGQEKCPDWIRSRFNNVFEYYVKTNPGLVSKDLLSELPKFTNPRLTDFWDTQNPASSPLGLSQYTNTNFLSDNTIPNNQPDEAHRFTLPVISNTNMLICEDYEPGSTKKRKYISRNTCGSISEARTVDHFAALSVLNKEILINPTYISTLRLWLDDNVHKTYAGELLPMAIGYSSSLLNYFFRGEIDAKFLPVFDESKLESVRIKVRNITPTKDSMGGNLDSKFYLAYRYRPPGAPADGSQDIWSQVPYVYPLPNALLYGKGDTGNDLEGPSYETEILFGGFPVDIPISNYQNAQFMLIYRGNLGEEKTNLANNELGGIIGKFEASKPITFHEENNTAPKGDYNWFQMDSPVFGSNVWDGVAQNEIVGGKLIKTNILNPSIPNTGAPWHFNTSLIGVHNLSGTTYANNIFPIPVTKDTYIEFKIDEMSMLPVPAPEGSYQGMVLSFSNGYKLEFSLGNQLWYLNNTTGYFSFNAGKGVVGNIHDLFKQFNLTATDGMKLNYIGLYQKIASNVPTDTQYEQKMIVDFIRIVEMEKMGPEQ
ncbi:MAG: hypothetical protein WBN66_08365 [Smithella sp.]